MRMIILGLVATAAIASPLAIATSANAATYDDTFHGTVAKSDVMQPLGLNEAKFQAAIKANPAALKVTQTLTTVKDTSWNCTDGSTVHHYYTTTTPRPVVTNTIWNDSATKVTGWTMDGLSSTDYGTTAGVVSGNGGTGRFPSYTCAAGSIDFMSMHVDQSHSIDVKATFNGSDVSIPNTPVLAPAV